MALNENQIRNNITKSVQNQIALQRQSINNGLGLQKQAFDNSINQNKAYLGEQIKGLNTQNTLNNDKSVSLQNRRGGFYSGGLDYQLAQNNQATTTARDNLTRDINSKNNDIQSQYNTLAGQAANQISLLEQQAPDKIRELVNAELDKQRSIQMEQEKWALQKQQMELALQKARAVSSGGSSGSSSHKSSSRKTTSHTSTKKLTPSEQRVMNTIDYIYPKKGRQIHTTPSLHSPTKLAGY